MEHIIEGDETEPSESIRLIRILSTASKICLKSTLNLTRTTKNISSVFNSFFISIMPTVLNFCLTDVYISDHIINIIYTHCINGLVYKR